MARFGLTLFTCSLLFSAPAFAETTGFSGEAALSASATTGNSETTDVGLALDLKNNADIWQHEIDVSYDYGTANGNETKNRFFIGYQIDRDVNEELYAFGDASYYTDEFGAYEFGYFVGGGLGQHVIASEPSNWDLEGAVGYRVQRARPLSNPMTPSHVDGDKVQEAAFLGRSEFSFEFNENVEVYNNTKVTAAVSDTYVWNDIGLSAKLTDVVSAKFGFRTDYHTDVPVGRKKLDTVTRAAIVYSIN